MYPRILSAAVLVLALYINSEQVNREYVNPWPLWFVCPLLLYWICRVWMYAKRSLLSEDPIVFAVRDRISLLIGGATVVLWVLASWSPQ